jgi:hypothetical protein
MAAREGSPVYCFVNYMPGYQKVNIWLPTNWDIGSRAWQVFVSMLIWPPGGR